MDVVPSPNCQYQLWVAAMFTKVLDTNWVVSPLQPGVGVKSTVGGAETTICCVAVSLQPPGIVTTNFAVYVPAKV